MNFCSSRLQRDVCFVAFLVHISEDMPCETRRAYAPSRSAFTTNFILKRSLGFPSAIVNNRPFSALPAGIPPFGAASIPLRPKEAGRRDLVTAPNACRPPERKTIAVRGNAPAGRDAGMNSDRPRKRQPKSRAVFPAVDGADPHFRKMPAVVVKTGEKKRGAAPEGDETGNRGRGASERPLTNVVAMVEPPRHV
jgi:hypothetical protein